MPQLNLYAVAERLVRKRGVDALTMDSLAEAAGVSRATAYRQLGSREALLEKLAERGVEIGERVDIRERILTAAAATFPRLGLTAATVEMIAEAAGVGSATVYRHFGDKKGLIQAFLNTQTPRHAAWALARQPSGDLRADLEQFARTALEFMKSRGSLLRLALREEPDGVLSEFKRSPDRTVHACAALLAHYARRGDLHAPDPQGLAKSFIGIVLSYGLFETLLGQPFETDIERDAHFAVELFLNGALHMRPARKSPARKKRKS